jgi:hypothetical protein
VSRCQLVAIEGVGRLCAVHGSPEPCGLNGDPALPFPIHVFTEPDRVGAIEKARESMAGSRPILVHQGHESDPGHLTTLGESDCWCEPITIPSG